MPVMDEFREEREALKTASLKVKWQYFLDYYKWYVIGGVAIFLFLFFLIRDMTNSKDWTFFGFFINAYNTDEASDAFFDEFAESAQLDLENYAADIDDTMSLNIASLDEVTMTSVNKLTVYMAAADVDFIAADATTFEHYASVDNFLDITQALTSEQLERYKDYIYYVDMAEVRAREEASLNGSFDDYVKPVYDHRKPEEMEDPHPVGLYIGHSEKLKSTYTFKEEEVVIGIPLNTLHLETVLQFIDYILAE